MQEKEDEMDNQIAESIKAAIEQAGMKQKAAVLDFLEDF